MSYMSELDAETRQEYLSDVSTNDLINELATREGIACYTVGDEEAYLIQRTTVEGRVENIERYHGSVTILTVVS